MLTGSVRRAGDKVRLSAELCDCESGTAIWSDRFAGEAADLFELQDELSARVVATIAPQVQESELRRVLRKHPESLDAYECVLRGLDLLYRFEDDPFSKALPLFERAMALDPRYADGLCAGRDLPRRALLRGHLARPAGRPPGGRAAEPAGALVRPLRSAGAVAVRPHPVVAVPRLRPCHRAVRPGAGGQSQLGHRLAAQQRHLQLHRRDARGAPPRRDRAAALALRRACLLHLRAGRAGEPTPPATMPRRRRGGGAPWRSIRASSATCASWPPAWRRAASSRRRARSGGRCCGSTRPSARATFAEGHAFKDAAQRRLFGEHLVLAGLPEQPPLRLGASSAQASVALRVSAGPPRGFQPAS